MFDSGYHPDTSASKYPNRSVRELQATIHYEAGPSCSTEPRTLTVYILKRPYKYYELKGAPLEGEEINLKDLYDLFPEENRSKIYKASNKKATWNEHRKVFALNMYGKMGMSSVKNMILVG